MLRDIVGIHYVERQTLTHLSAHLVAGGPRRRAFACYGRGAWQLDSRASDAATLLSLFTYIHIHYLFVLSASVHDRRGFL